MVSGLWCARMLRMSAEASRLEHARLFPKALAFVNDESRVDESGADHLAALVHLLEEERDHEWSRQRMAKAKGSP